MPILLYAFGHALDHKIIKNFENKIKKRKIWLFFEVYFHGICLY